MANAGVVLIVDDEVSNLKTLMSCLEAANFRVLVAKKAPRALKIAASAQPDLILLDIRMPELDGYDLCSELKNQPSTREIPVIFMTAYHKDVDRVRCFAVGGVDYIAKPFQVEEVLARVQHQITIRSLQAQLKRKNAELELRVRERTAELEAANVQLQEEVRERQEVEAALREAQERYKLAVRGSGDGIWDWNIATCEAYLSPRFQEILSYEEDEPLWPSWQDFEAQIHPSDRPRVLESLEAHLQQHLPCNLECRIRTKTGQYRWVSLRGQAIWDEAGNPTRMAGSISDITQLKQTEKALRRANEQLEERVQERTTALQETNDRLIQEVCDRVEAEVALREAQERYKLAVRGSGDGIWDWNLANNETYISPRYKEILGYQESDLEDFSHPDFEEWLHPEDRDRVSEALRSHLEERSPYHLEYRIGKKNGDYCWISARGQAIWDETGNPTRMAGSISDITPLKQIEEALRHSNEELELRVRERTSALQESEQRLRAILEHTTSVIYLKDFQGRYLLVNPQFLQIFALSSEEVLGKSDRDLLPPEIAAAYMTNDRQVFEAGMALEFEEEAQFANGEYHTYISIKTPLRDSSGAIYALCGISTDITQQKQAEAALRESEERFRTMADSAPVLIWMSGLDKRCTYFNQTWLQFTGRTLAQEVALDWEDTIHDEDGQFCVETYTTSFDARLPFQIEYRLRRRDGEYRWVLDTGVPRFNLNGEFVGYIGSCIDITEIKEAREALRQTNAELERRVEERTAALSHSEEKFRNVFQTAAVGMCLLSVAGNYLAVNSALSQILGYSESELLSMTLEEVTHLEDIEASRQYSQRAIAGEISYFHTEQRFYHKDGGIVWVLQSISLVRDQNERPLYFIALVQDISDRVSAEERLRLLERAVSASQNGILVADATSPDTPAIYVNSGFERLTGYSAAETLGRNFRFLNQVDRDQAGLQELRQAIQEGKDCQTILQNYRKDGTSFWNQLTLSPVRDTRDNVTHFVAIQTDITDRLATEEALKRNEALLRAINQASPLGVYVANADSDRVLFYNRQFCHLWQLEGLDEERDRDSLSNDEVLSRCLETVDIESFVSTAHPDAFEDDLVTVEDEIPLQDGRILRRIYTPVRDSDRHFGYLSIFEDITERKHAETQLQQLNEELLRSNAQLETAKQNAEAANRAKSDFLAKMTHELRTPLNAILGFTQILSYGANLEDKQRQQLHIVLNSGEHLLTLIDDILNMSKIEAGKSELNLMDFNLARSLDTLEQMFQLKAQTKGIELHFSIDPNIPQFVRADEQKLRQVLINLIGNAIKFTHEGGVFLRASVGQRFQSTVGTFHETSVQGSGTETGRRGAEEGRGAMLAPHANHSPEPRVADRQNPPSPEFIGKGRRTNDQGQMTLHFEVQDTGRGIAAEELETIFDAFAQSQVGRETSEGTGLGLTISKNFVELMGGQLLIESTLGGGTTLSFAIAIDPAQGHEERPSQPSQRVIGLAPNQGPYRILVVEDRWENRQLLLQFLSPLGFNIIEAENGGEGIQMWQQHDPHLILMDLRMPGMNGYEAIQRIKASPKGRETPIIALTASAFDKDRHRLLSFGCSGCLRKPFREGELLQKIADCLKIQYVYQTDRLPAGPEPEPPAQLTPEALEVMPFQWLSELHRAAIICDREAVVQLLDRIPPEHQPLKRELMNLTDNFRFGAIADLIPSAMN